MKIDLILLTYKPGKPFINLVKMINEQDSPINKIYVANAEQKYYDRLSYTDKSFVEVKNITVRHMSRRECDGGKTRNQLVEMSDADYFIVMGQNAVPQGLDLVTKLLNAFKSDNKVAVAYARHIASDNCPEYIKYVKKYYFPDNSYIRSERDLANYGRMTYFVSNECAMYRKDIFEELGGFDSHVIINEDILYSFRAINAGYKVAYVADAQILIENEKDNYDYVRKNFDFGVITSMYPEVFSYQENLETGKKIVKMIKNHLSRNGYRSATFSFARFASKMVSSYKKGYRYKMIPKEKLAKYSDNKSFWNTDEIVRARSLVNARLGYGRSEEETNMLKTPPVNRYRWDDKENQ